MQNDFMNKERLSRLIWHMLPIVGLVIWGALSLTNYLWYDEAYSAALVSLNIRELIDITSKDVHSPFYYLLAKAFYHLCGGGTNYWSLKVFSLLFSLGYLLVGKYWVKKLYDEKVSIYFMAFSILMPVMTVQATNVRMYSCGLFFLTVAGLCMIELYRGDDDSKLWIVMTLSSACSVYCHTFQMLQTLFLYGFFFIGLLYKKQYKRLKTFFFSGFFVAVVYLPWLRVLYWQMQERIAQTAQEVVDNAAGEKSLNALITYSKEWFSAGETPIATVMYLGMALTIFLGYYAVDYMRKEKDYIAGIGIGVIAITAVLGTYLNNNVASCFMGRYVFSAFGTLALLYALGMRQMEGKWLKVGVWCIAAYCFLMQYRSELQLEYDTEIEKYFEFIEQNVDEDDVIMAENNHLLMLSVYYPELQYMAYGNLPGFMPFEVNGVFTAWEQLEDVTGTVWFLGPSTYFLADRYSAEAAIKFHHMYYDFELYEMIPLEQE